MTVLRQAALLLLLMLAPALLWAAPRIGVVTMQPGEEYWSRFGHNAILVESPGGERLLYNYGFFDFEQPGFLARFLRGRMLYQLAVLPYAQDLAYYDREGRGVSLQWLRLNPVEADRLATFLEWNARPENAEYRYDYFLDNCATRVRDALDLALDGVLKSQLVGRSRGLSFRSESQRLAAPEPWLYLGIDVGLGPMADRALSRWDEGFVPMRLADALREARASDGGALVASELELLPHRLAPAREEPPRVQSWFAASGAVLALLLWWLAGRTSDRHRRSHALLAAGLWTVCGLGGLLLLGLWLLTDHLAAHANANLLLLNPLCLLLLPSVRALWLAQAPARSALWLTGIVALAGICLLPALSLRLISQDIFSFLLLLLPAHLVLWHTFWRRSAPMPARAPG